MSRKGGENGDDRALWEMVAKTVRPFRRRKEAAKQSSESNKPKPSPVKMQPAPRPEPRPPAPGARPPPSAGFDAATREKLKRGKLSIEARLDLHGMTRDEAYGALHRFIRRAESAGARTLLIITGKGRVGGGTLRRMVPLWLQETELRDVVLAVETSRAKDGGEGALYVRLRNPKKK
ncbi:MAG: DNA mismatch repair protein MutS [Alphaproteobacteria bacterium]|nr:MAG: DNA mismatch repair protein MutS [Alphaproteobacteria bacterium]